MKTLTPYEQTQLMHNLYQAYGTQKAVAEALHVSQQVFNYWLHVAKKPPYEKTLEMQLLWEKIQKDRPGMIEKKLVPAFLVKEQQGIQITLQETDNCHSSSQHGFFDIDMIYRDEKLKEAEAHIKLPLRSIFVILLIYCCDRHGEFKLNPQTLKEKILPYVNINFEVAVNTLCELGLIEPFSYQKETYGLITLENYQRHTDISKTMEHCQPGVTFLHETPHSTEKTPNNKTIH